MARLARLTIKDCNHYVILYGRKGRSLIPRSHDLEALFKIFAQLVVQYDVDVSGYVILPEQIHLVLNPHKNTEDLSKFVQSAARLYSRYFNDSYRTTGTIWHGRFASSVVQGGSRVLDSILYMEHLPEILSVQEADLYPWSSYFHHAGLRNDYFMLPCADYWALGNTPYERQKSYKVLFARGYPAELGSSLMKTVKRGWPMADRAFLEENKIDVGRIEPQRKRGRPPKSSVSP